MNSQTEESGSGKKHEVTIYISNMSEDVWPFISAMSDPDARRYEIEENATLSDRDLFAFAGEDHLLFISPKPVSREFQLYYLSLFGNTDFIELTPRQHSGEICKDILRDETIMQAIVRAANSSKRLTVIPYVTSMQFLRLVEELRSRELDIFTPESPEEEDAWTVNFYGSKSGIRQLAQKSSAAEPDFAMPDGLICVNVLDASRIAAKKYLRNQGVVLKTNKGHSGAGLLIFRPGDLPVSYHACAQEILETLKKDAYWDRFPIVIEDYIATNPQVAGGNPNVEFKIYKSGRIDFLYYCILRVTDSGVFKGIEISSGVMPDRVAAQLVDTGFFIAEQFAGAGYRGYFDVDYVAGRSGKLYVTESNVRRTGGTHVYHVAVALFGKDFMYRTYVLSNNLYPLPNKKKISSFSRALECIKPVLYDRKTGEGVILASERVISIGCLAYIVFGRTERRALEIEREMESLIAAKD
ncbi:hypothetical protein A2Z33_03230 [Candidatus Gottesmanbacteria bacterium RBG_16_52_11]|uniref:ATP-grasp domain-containing protein n=1 Tax=Candidatus Gottesmanbacteria bacterium RBG_16_52_11 TaxID=1798374 RepID=A0A1F5YW01_9BACT|nr:MAG: hypothetical protein A2Z33_03230 [Candidatus Gottesmanbacteria bacterium RBG_16_52_11]